MNESVQRLLPGRRARVVVGLVILALIVLFAGIAGELQRRYAWANDTLDALGPRHARLLGLQQLAPQIDKAVEASMQELAHFAHPAAMPADRIGTELQQRVRQLAESVGFAVVNSRILPVRPQGALEFVSVVVTIQGDERNLRAISLALREERPALLLDSATLQGMRGRGADKTLTALLTVSAIRVTE